MFEAARIQARDCLARFFALAGILTWFLIAVPHYSSALDLAGSSESTQVIVESKLDELSEDDQGCRIIRLSLGEHETSVTLAIKWLVLNNAVEGMDLPRSTSSCGCIQGVPPGISISIGETATVEFQLQVPIEEGRISKQIAFFDRGGICRVRLEIELDAVSPFVVQEVVPLEREGKQTLVVPLGFEAEGRSLDEFGLNVVGAGILGSRMVPGVQGSNSRIELEVDTKPMGNDSLVRVEFEFSSLERGVVHSKLERTLWIQNRPFTKPKVVALLRDADGWLGEFKLCVNAMVGWQQETLANDAVLSDASGKILPIKTQFEINTADGQDWTVGVDCKIRIDDPKQLLNRGNVVTATFTIQGKIVHAKCIATR